MQLAKEAQAGRSRTYSMFETYSSLFDGVRAYLLVQRPGRDTERSPAVGTGSPAQIWSIRAPKSPPKAKATIDALEMCSSKWGAHPRTLK